jgi:hypothetical protein
LSQNVKGPDSVPGTRPVKLNPAVVRPYVAGPGSQIFSDAEAVAKLLLVNDTVFDDNAANVTPAIITPVAPITPTARAIAIVRLLIAHLLKLLYRLKHSATDIITASAKQPSILVDIRIIFGTNKWHMPFDCAQGISKQPLCPFCHVELVETSLM